jgi:hypothetical protein
LRRALVSFLGLAAFVTIASAQGGAVRTDGVVALMLVQDRAGDPAAVAAVEEKLRWDLGRGAQVVDPVRTRDALRQLRMRDADQASPLLLQRVARELGADWLLSATLHDVERRDTPRLTLSARAYQGSTGELLWAGFRSESGLDSRTVLGLKEILELEVLARRTAEHLVMDLMGSPGDGGGKAVRPPMPTTAVLGRLAIVPLGGITTAQATLSAETITEAVRATAYRLGVPLVSPGCASQVLRRQWLGQRGGVDARTRDALRGTCGADTILTGMVERYHVGVESLEPDPNVAIALRLVSSETGKIVWTGAQERTGAKEQGLFRIGRVYSRGALAERMVEAMARRMLKERQRALRRAGERG